MKPRNDPRRRVVRVLRDATALRASREDVARSGNLVNLEEPTFLSVVKRPANRTPFKVVRDAEQAERNDSSPLRSVTLPAGVSDAEANAVFAEFGFTENEYEIKREGDLVRFVSRADLGEEEDPETVTIWLPSGITVQVAQNSDGPVKGVSSADRPQLAVVKYTFDKERYAKRDDVEAWLSEAGVSNYQTEDLFQISGEFVLRRHDTTEKLVRVDVEKEGVTAYVAQSDKLEVPQRIYRAVVEEAFGVFGFGSISFLQMMANEMFTRDGREAVFALWDVLDNILFFSELPLEDRKALMFTALEEFGTWMSMLIDLLPRAAVEPEGLINQRKDGSKGVSAKDGDKTADADGGGGTSKATKETADMSEDKARKKEQRSDEGSPADVSDDSNTQRNDGGNAGEAGTGGDEQITVSRADLAQIAKDAAAEAVKGVNAQRSDGGDTGAGGSADAGQSGGDKGAEPSIRDLVARQDALEEENKSLKARLEETVVRDDVDDGEGGDDAGDGDDPEKVKREDPYRGALFGRAMGRGR